MVFSSLPIEEIRRELMEALRVPSPRILLKAPTGSGKSTIAKLIASYWDAGGGRSSDDG